MAKSNKKKEKKVGGPFLSAAVFCESVLEDATKKISAMGIMDGVQFWIAADAPKNVPSKEQPITFFQNLLITFRSGDEPGKHELRLVLEQSNGKRKEVAKQQIELTPPSHGGFNFKGHVNISVFTSQTHWLDVYLDGKRFTRMPLNVLIKRLPKK